MTSDSIHQRLCGSAGSMGTTLTTVIVWAVLMGIAIDGPAAENTEKNKTNEKSVNASISSSATSDALPPAVKVTEIEGISEYRLPNGVRVLLFPEPSKEVVTVNMTVFVGSRHEGYGEAGMAHLLEHMLFKGTPTHQEIPKLLKDRGARMNGTTWVDRTNYYETLPSKGDNLEFAIRLEADRLVNSLIRGEDLEKEMTVVRNEFERSENSPIGVLMQRMHSAAYDWHNYGQSTIGNRSDIERVPVVKLRQFYKKYYRPDNLMLTVAGNFKTDDALPLVAKYFGSLTKPNRPIDETYTTEPAQDGERTVVLRRVGESQAVGATYHVPAASHPDFAAVQALVQILGHQPSGRLYQQLVEPKIVTNAFAFARAFAEPGLLMTIAEVDAGESIEHARASLVSTMESTFTQQPVSQAELNRAVQQILKQRELQSADTAELAIALSDWAAQGDWRMYFLYRDNVEKLTLDDLQRVAQKYFVRNNRTVGLFIPTEQSQRAVIPEAPDLKELLAGYKGREAIEAGEVIDPSPLAIEQRTERGQLTDGIEYALLPKKTRGGTVNLALTLRFGSEETLKDKIGAVELLGLLMSKGTDKLDYTQLQDELTRLRADLSMNSTIGLLSMNVKTKREFLPEVIALIGDIVRRPRLDAGELEVIKRQVVNNLKRSSTEPNALAPRKVRQLLAPYPKTNIRYVMSIKEEMALYESVTADQIRELHRDFVSAQAGELSMVGDFDPEEVKSAFQSELADWTSDNPYQRVDRDPRTDVAGSTHLIETPDKANALLYGGRQYAISDETPEYASMVLANYIIGGGGALSSRLGDRVRQKEGLSYGISTGVTPRAKDTRVDFTIYAITNPQNRDRLLEVIRDEFARIRKDGITQEELDQAKGAYLESARVNRSDDRLVASELLGTMFNERTMVHKAELEERIKTATVQSVNAAIVKYFDIDAVVLVVAGDFAASATK